MKTARIAIDAEWEELAPRLSAAERWRLQGMRNRDAARQSAHAWVALKTLAGEGAEVWHDGTGRPHLRGSDAHVGLAHKSRFAFVALGDAPLGIDVEDLDQPLSLGSFLKGTCAPEERRLAEMSSSLAMSLHEVAIVFWSLKEAACKWAGRPLIPRQCRVRSITDGGDASVEFADGADAPELSWSTQERHVFCVAARRRHSTALK